MRRRVFLIRMIRCHVFPILLRQLVAVNDLGLCTWSKRGGWNIAVTVGAFFIFHIAIDCLVALAYLVERGRAAVIVFIRVWMVLLFFWLGVQRVWVDLNHRSCWGCEFACFKRSFRFVAYNGWRGWPVNSTGSLADNIILRSYEANRLAYGSRLTNSSRYFTLQNEMWNFGCSELSLLIKIKRVSPTRTLYDSLSEWRNLPCASALATGAMTLLFFKLFGVTHGI